MLSIISSMAVLPNRFLVKLDPTNDWFKTYTYHEGVLRLTIASGENLGGKASKTKNFLKKLTKDVPDCYVKVNVSAEEEWRTGVKNNSHHPTWNETHDFLVTDHDQCIKLDVQDDDVAGDDDIGVGETTVKSLILNGKKDQITLTNKGEATEAKVSISCDFFNFVPDTASFSSASEGQICGLATVLIAGAFGLQGNKEDLEPSVKVLWGKEEFQTAVKSYTPGVDIFSPAFDAAFKIPLTGGNVGDKGDFRIVLMDGKREVGEARVGWEDVVGGEGMTRAERFEVGGGAEVRASIRVRGTKVA